MDQQATCSRAVEVGGPASSTSEETLMCPYESTHLVTTRNMSKHMEKCRKNYEHQLLRRGDTVNMMTCKYNYRHEVLPPEIFYHEERCEDRHHIPFYMLNINHPELQDDDDEGLKFNLEDCDYSEIYSTEWQRMYEGLFLNEFIGTANPSLISIPFEDIRDPESAREWRDAITEDERVRNRAEHFKISAGRLRWDKGGWLKKSFEDMLIEMERNTPGSRVITDDGGDDEDVDDEDERYWNVPNRITFDYMVSCRNPQKPMFRYPPGLTYSERREFDKWNTNWIARILRPKEKADEATEASTVSSVTTRSDTSESAIVTDSDLSETESASEHSDIGYDTDMDSYLDAYDNDDDILYCGEAGEAEEVEKEVEKEVEEVEEDW